MSTRCRIIEFAGVVLDGCGTAIARYETVLDPGTAPGPTWIHGLKPSDVRGAPAFADVAGDIQRFFRDRIPVAHHLRFDWAVLRRAFEPLGVTLAITPGGVCTAALCEQRYGARMSLAQLCRHLGIDHPRPHQAASDAEATACVLRALLAEGHPVRGRPLAPFPGAWRLPRSVAPAPRARPVEPVQVNQVVP